MSSVLIIADREGERQVALERGMELARKMGYAVQVVGFCYEPLSAQGITEPGQQAKARKRLLSHRRAEVEARIRKLKPPGVRVRATAVWQQDIHLWLNRRCARQAHAAVVKTGHRTESFLYTSTDWRLLRECPAPVLICAEKKWRSTKPIVAAIDVGDRSRVKQRLDQEVIATAKHYAEALGCPLYLVHALYISPVLTELDLVDEYTQVRKIEEELKPHILRLSRRHGIPVKQFRMKHGPADKVITSEAARLKAQLLVMGTVGRKGVKAALLGNTAEAVLSRLRTDVLALKP